MGELNPGPWVSTTHPDIHANQLGTLMGITLLIISCYLFFSPFLVSLPILVLCNGLFVLSSYLLFPL